MSDIKKISVLGVKVSVASKQKILAWIEERIEKSLKTLIFTPNPEQVMLAQKDRSFRKILNGGSLALCDGEGLRFAALYTGKNNKIPERVTGEEVMQELVKRAARNGWRVFLLGGREGVARKAGEIFEDKYKNLDVEASSGSEDVEKETKAERKEILKKLNKFKPDILFVAFGAPKQEKWLSENWDDLDIKVGMVVGGALDMIVDPTLKPPNLMSSLGLDWFYRLLRQPWRIKRQMDLLRFLTLIVRERF